MHRIRGRFTKLTLSVTERCNLRCRYCIYSGGYPGRRIHGKDDMSWETAKAALDCFLGGMADAEGATFVTFYGGEPWLNARLIRASIAYVSATAPYVQFHATTNGTLLTDDLADYLAAHDVKIRVSLDGPREVHDRNRVAADGTGSFERIWANLTRLRERHGDYYRASVSFVATIADPSDGERVVDFFLSYPSVFAAGRVKLARVAAGHRAYDRRGPGGQTGRGRLERRFLSKVTSGETGDSEAALLRTLFESPYLTIHRRHIDMDGLGEACHLTSSCFPGFGRLFVRPCGEYLLCEKVGEGVSIGDVAGGIDAGRVMALYEQFCRLYNGPCRRCWAVGLCQSCYLHCSQRTGQMETALRPEDCLATIDYWRRHLVRYCSMLEANPRAFDFLDTIATTAPPVPELEALGSYLR